MEINCITAVRLELSPTSTSNVFIRVCASAAGTEQVSKYNRPMHGVP
jgi:hypothetical protein